MEKDMSRHSLFTSNFKENLFFFVKCLIMLFVVVVIITRFMPSFTGEYTASLLDKVERLETIQGPKIVLLGNSNLVYGIKSEMIEREIGMPVVNMGLHGGLGNAFHEQMAKLNVCEGDIYIICHTDYCDLDIIEDNTVAWVTVENHLKLWKLIRPKDVLPFVRAFPIYLKKCIERESTGNRNIRERRYMFNEYGDSTVVREGPQKELVLEGAIWPPNVTERVTNRINKLNAYLNKRGATLLMASPPLAQGEYSPEVSWYQGIQRVLENQLDCPFISDFTDYMYDYSYFYDTVKHLTDKGAVMRTEQLIEDIKNYMADSD